MPTIHYPFAQAADRLIQVAARKDGCIQVIRRARNPAGTWPQPANPPNPFFAPLNGANPIEFTLAANDGSWATAALQVPEWDKYLIASLYVLGKPGPYAEQFAPNELDYGGGNQEPNPPGYGMQLRGIVQGARVEFFDPDAPAGWQKTSLDTSQWYSQYAAQQRACFVLRVCGTNHATLTLKNVDTRGGPTTIDI